MMSSSSAHPLEGVEALISIVQTFPPDLQAAVFVVMHLSPHGPSYLTQILARSGPLSVITPQDRSPIKRGQIYVAPPDNHLLLERDYVRVVRGPKENRFRPAIDPLFRSAARAFDSRVIGVILSGNLDDGTAGMWAIKDRGGISVVQDPADAMSAQMPRSVLDNVDVDYIKNVGEIGALLVKLVSTPAPELNLPTNPLMEVESQIAKGESQTMHQVMRPGTPSVYSCPECHGVLWEIREGAIVRYRCRTGHAFSAESMFAQQADALENGLWMVLKNLEEMRAFCVEMQHQNGEVQAQSFREKAEESTRTAETIRQIIKQSRLNGAIAESESRSGEA